MNKFKAKDKVIITKDIKNATIKNCAGTVVMKRGDRYLVRIYKYLHLSPREMVKL